MSCAAQMKLSPWTNGRALVLGDAAFGTFGVGTSPVIKSAYILAGELSKIQSSDDVPQALEKEEEVFAHFIQKLKNFQPGFHNFFFHRRLGPWVKRHCIEV